VTRRAGSKAPPAVLRRHKCLWTPEEDALLTREWGELAERSLRQKLGRSANALLIRARELGLPSQAQGRTLVTHACRNIGVWHDTLYRLLDECGLRAEDAAPLRPAGTRGETRHLAIDADAAEVLLAVRDARIGAPSRTSTASSASVCARRPGGTSATRSRSWRRPRAPAGVTARPDPGATSGAG
jgi:hypothetical protein